MTTKKLVSVQVKLDTDTHHKLSVKLAEDQKTFQDVLLESLKSYLCGAETKKKK